MMSMLRNYRQGIFFTQWSKNGTFIRAKMWAYSPQNCQNFKFWPEICASRATHLQYFNEIISICTCLYVVFKFLVWSLSRDKHPSYKHFPTVRAFSHKFSIALAAKLLIGPEKLGDAKIGMDLLYHHAQHGGDRGSRAGCRRKSVMFFVRLSRFGITKFVITETL